MGLYRFDGQWLAPDATPIAFNCIPMLQKDKGATTTQDKKKKIKKRECLICEQKSIENGKVELVLPILTVSEGNCHAFWRIAHQRHKSQQKAIFIAMMPVKQLIALPCIITCTRLAPRNLDEHDNLRFAFKYIVDKIAEELTGKNKGKGDNDPRLSWKYSQEKSQAKGIKILFEF